MTPDWRFSFFGLSRYIKVLCYHHILIDIVPYFIVCFSNPKILPQYYKLRFALIEAST
jgi:hypothetical protein